MPKIWNKNRFVVHDAVSQKSDTFVVGLDCTQFVSPNAYMFHHIKKGEASGLSY